MTIGPAPLCIHCVYNAPSGVMKCKAFPAGIPETILQNEWDHRRSNGLEAEDENGNPYLFEPLNPTAGEIYANLLFETE